MFVFKKDNEVVLHFPENATSLQMESIVRALVPSSPYSAGMAIGVIQHMMDTSSEDSPVIVAIGNCSLERDFKFGKEASIPLNTKDHEGDVVDTSCVEVSTAGLGDIVDQAIAVCIAYKTRDNIEDNLEDAMAQLSEALGVYIPGFVDDINDD
jgi:hypothetical protein